MAWIDDRLWCHPKIATISDSAFRSYVNSVSYSSGMGLAGVLEHGHQKLIGANAKVRRELVDAGLWDENGDGVTVYIHDWHEHNSKRDERRKRDRERKRQLRASAGTSAGTSAGRSRRRSTVAACVDGSEGSEGSEGSD